MIWLFSLMALALYLFVGLFIAAPTLFQEREPVWKGYAIMLSWPCYLAYHWTRELWRQTVTR